MSTAPEVAAALADEWLTKHELAAWLKISEGTIDSRVFRKTIPFTRLGPRTVRFSRAAISAWLLAGAVEVTK